MVPSSGDRLTLHVSLMPRQVCYAHPDQFDTVCPSRWGTTYAEIEVLSAQNTELSQVSTVKPGLDRYSVRVFYFPQGILLRQI